MRRLSLLIVLVALFFCMVSPTLLLAGTPPSTTITLDRAVHFSAAAGGEAVAPAGDYTVLAVENSRLLLIPEKGTVPLLIQAETTSHEENLRSAVARSITGEGDEHHILVFLPGGQGRDALGFYTGGRTKAGTTARGPSVEKGPSPALRAVPDPSHPITSAASTSSGATPKALPPADSDAQILTAVQSVDGRIASIEMRLEAMERALAAFESKLGAQFETLDRKLEGLKK